jgi:hypothetical protein
MISYLCRYKDHQGKEHRAVFICRDAFHARLTFEEMVGFDSAHLIGILPVRDSKDMWE